MVSSTVPFSPDLGPILFKGTIEAFWLIFTSCWYVWLLLIAIIFLKRVLLNWIDRRRFIQGEKWRSNRDLSRQLRGMQPGELRETAMEKCPRCGGNLVERGGKFGKFYGCSNYPKCRFTKKI
jgi:hypothetical protein